MSPKKEVPPDRLKLTWIVNGHPHEMRANASAPIRHFIDVVLHATGNIGRALDHWEVRDITGRVLDVEQPIGESVSDGATLYLSPFAGVGGHGPGEAVLREVEAFGYENRGCDERWIAREAVRLAFRLSGAAVPPVVSQVRLNAERDPNYAPYCLRCRSMNRMTRIESFLWECLTCGATHDERTPALSSAHP